MDLNSISEKKGCSQPHILQLDLNVGEQADVSCLTNAGRDAAVAGYTELHLLCAALPPWSRREVLEALELSPIPVRLFRPILHGLEGDDSSNRSVVEIGLLDAEILINQDGTQDVRLVAFSPCFPSQLSSSVDFRSSADSRGFDYIMDWGVDFDFEGQSGPFRHFWFAARTPEVRVIPLRSNAHFRRMPQGSRPIGVKVVDVFGYETIAIASPGGPERESHQ